MYSFPAFSPVLVLVLYRVVLILAGISTNFKNPALLFLFWYQSSAILMPEAVNCRQIGSVFAPCRHVEAPRYFASGRTAVDVSLASVFFKICG